jgi:uncharacterized protein YebE (UPF0316 family)
MLEFLEENPWILCGAIFGARVLDVSLGTLRTILVFRGHRLFAVLTGFFEVLIWLAAAGQVLRNLGEWYLLVSYAGGFAAGNYVGMWIEAKLAIGSELVRIISRNRDVELALRLRERGFSVIELVGSDDTSQAVEVLLIVTRRRRVRALLAVVTATDPDAVWTVNDVRPRPELRLAGGLRTRRGPRSWMSRVVRK